MGDIVLWTIVECDLALIAGSLPMIRTLFKFLKEQAATTKPTGHKSNPTELHSLGLDSNRKGYIRQSESREAITTKDGAAYKVTVTQAYAVTTEGRSLEHVQNMDSEYQYQAKSYV